MLLASRLTLHLGRVVTLLVAAVVTERLTAAPVDESKLPPAATNKVDFLRDIKPILDGSCLKCHGPEKPKSSFRVDNREALLKGGDNGIAVVPGESAKSPLIHFVARLVEDMEMPPAGKGDVLSAAQISLLRAWIDQGVSWVATGPESRTTVDTATTFRWITVDGDQRKFREHQWFKEGWDGGIANFDLKQQLDLNRRFIISGHALRDDYKVTLSLERSDSFFIRGGYEQYRKYFDDSGGYYSPFAVPFFSLGRDLHLDLGKAWIEAGGTTPFGLQLTGGYEYHFKEGAKSLTQWQPIAPGGNSKNILPNAKNLDERRHVLRLDAGYDWKSLRLSDNLRYEFYDLDTSRSMLLAGFPFLLANQRMNEGTEMRTLANAFRAETQPRDWLLLSAGYLYTHVDGESSVRQTSVDASGLQGPGLLWNSRGITLEEAAHIFNANAQIGLWAGMTFSAGVQTEWNRQRSFGDVNLDYTDPLDASVIFTNLNGRVNGDYDRFTAEEKFTLRNVQIPYTVLYGEARLRQERIQQLEEHHTVDTDTGLPFDTQEDFLRDTAARYDWRQVRAGFNVSPWTRISLNAYAQRRDHDDRFDHERDEKTVSLGQGYPAFITERETMSDEVGAKLTIRPATWLKTTLSYKVVTTDFKTVTDPVSFGTDSSPGGRILAGESDAHVYSLNATLTPWRRLYFYSTFAFQDTRTITADNGSPSIVPFRGHIYSVLQTARYLLDEKTDLSLSYDFSYADYGQDNVANGLPLGIDYRRHGVRAGLGRRFFKRFLANLEYAWFLYDEPSSGGRNDYTAHGVFATLHARWD
jgi:hypothetical protein